MLILEENLKTQGKLAAEANEDRKDLKTRVIVVGASYYLNLSSRSVGLDCIWA